MNHQPHTPVILPHFTLQFLHLPLHILITITSYLPLSDQISLSQTCTTLFKVVQHTYSQTTVLNFRSTLLTTCTFPPTTTRNALRIPLGTGYINLPDNFILSILHAHTQAKSIRYFHLPPCFKSYDLLYAYFSNHVSPLYGGNHNGLLRSVYIDKPYRTNTFTTDTFQEVYLILKLFSHYHVPLLQLEYPISRYDYLL